MTKRWVVRAIGHAGGVTRSKSGGVEQVVFDRHVCGSKEWADVFSFALRRWGIFDRAARHLRLVRWAGESSVKGRGAVAAVVAADVRVGGESVKVSCL